MATAGDFVNMVPGFDFFQGLMKSAGAGMPGVSQWIAPTLNPEELEKRIDELRTVQFWLEQNARMLGVTIQALEVQRLTLSTLKSMNLPLAEISESLRMKPPEPPAAPAPVPAPPPVPEPPAQAAPAATAAAAGGADPLQWWGALTQQFAELAANAVKDGGAAAVKGLSVAAGPAVAEVARPAPKVAAKTPRKVAAPRKRSA